MTPNAREPATAFPRCPHCQAEILPEDARCWLCHQPLEPLEPAKPKPLPPELEEIATGRAAAARRTFTLSSLMLLIVVIAVFLGVVAQAPGLAIPMAVLIAPGLIRTVRAAYRGKAEGRPLSAGEKAGVFLATVAAVVTVGAASFAAFFATCLSVCLLGSGAGYSSPLGNVLVLLALGGGAVVGLAVFILTTRYFVRRAHRGRRP